MTDFGGTTTNVTTKAHLAVINGGVSTPNAVTDLASAARAAQMRGASSQATRFDSAGVETARNRSVSDVRAVARAANSFDESTLFSMIRAAGLPEDRAEMVWNVVKSNPALLAQAERAFNRAQLDVVN